MADKIFYWVTLALSILALAICINGYFDAVKHREAFDTVCTAKGGVVVQGTWKLLCIQQRSVIDL